MEKNFIKVLNPDRAKELTNLGFKYTLETVNEKPIHSFFASEEIMQYIHKHFDHKDFLLSNKMTF